MRLTLPKEPKLIAFTGYGTSGKDEAARPLVAEGYERRCFGDIIKYQIDPLIQQHLGFSAFTDDPMEKAWIRPILEQWGEVNYDNISDEFFDKLPDYCVNTRICRLAEIAEWKARGGVVVGLSRTGVTPQTEWERHLIYEQLKHGYVNLIIENDDCIDRLHKLLIDLFLWDDGKIGWKKIDGSGDRPWHVRVSRGLQSLRKLPHPPDGL